MVEIVQNGHPALREISKEVDLKDIGSKNIKKILKDMSQALSSQNDGVAIAAPQIGINLRIFTISGNVFDEDFSRKEGKTKEQKHKDVVCINPIFKKMSKDRKLMSEGCLSVRPLYGKVRRATKATIEAYDQDGKKFTLSGNGLLAHIFQHEIDHLDGILFIDKAKDIHQSSNEDEYSE
jgi:peptide deformylase